MALEQLEIILTLKENISSGAERVKSSLRGISDAAKSLSAQVQSSFEQINGKTQNVGRQFVALQSTTQTAFGGIKSASHSLGEKFSWLTNAVQSGVSRMGNLFNFLKERWLLVAGVIGAGIAGLAYQFRQLAAYADKMADLALQARMTSSEFWALSKAMEEEVGVSAEALAKDLARLPLAAQGIDRLLQPYFREQGKHMKELQKLEKERLKLFEKGIKMEEFKKTLENINRMIPALQQFGYTLDSISRKARVTTYDMDALRNSWRRFYAQAATKKATKELMGGLDLDALRLQLHTYTNMLYQMNEASKFMLSEYEKNLEILSEAMNSAEAGVSEMANEFNVSMKSIQDNLPILMRLKEQLNSLSTQGRITARDFLAILDTISQIRDFSLQAAILKSIAPTAVTDLTRVMTRGVEPIREKFMVYEKIAPPSEAIERLASFNDAVDRIKNSLSALAMLLAEKLTPSLELIAGILERITNLLNEFSKEHPTISSLVVNLSALLLVFSVLRLAFAGIGKAFSFFGGSLGWLKTIVFSIGGWIVRGITMIVGAIAAITGLPAWLVGLIIAALAAVIAVIVLYWDKIKAFIGKCWEFIKEKYNQFVEWASDWLAKAFVKIGEWWDKIKSWISEKWNELVENAKKIGERFIAAIVDGIKAGWNWLVNKVKELVAKIRNFLPFSPAKEGALRDLPYAGVAFVKTFAEGIRSAAPMLSHTLNSILPHALPSPRLARTPFVSGAKVYTFHIVTSDELDERIQARINHELVDLLRSITWSRGVA